MKHSIIEAIEKLKPVLQYWEIEEILNGNYDVKVDHTPNGEKFTFVLRTQMIA